MCEASRNIASTNNMNKLSFSCFRLKFLKFLISFLGSPRQISYTKMGSSIGISAIFRHVYVINDCQDMN